MVWLFRRCARADSGLLSILAAADLRDGEDAEEVHETFNTKLRSTFRKAYDAVTYGTTVSDACWGPDGGGRWAVYAHAFWFLWPPHLQLARSVPQVLPSFLLPVRTVRVSSSLISGLQHSHTGRHPRVCRGGPHRRRHPRQRRGLPPPCGVQLLLPPGLLRHLRGVRPRRRRGERELSCVRTSLCYVVLWAVDDMA